MSAPLAAEDNAGDARPQREVAQRIFAGEFAEAKHSFKETGERSPSFVVSPFGAKVNRLFAVGVLTNVESIGQTPGNYRAQVVDPTGTFYLLSGQYEPEATACLADIRPPELVAIVGKSRVRETPEGATYVNVRPERIHVVTKADRDEWVAETARHSIMRLEAMREAMKMEPPTVKAIEDIGYPKDIAEGVVRAFEHYGKVDLAKQATLIRDALESLLPGSASKYVMETPSFAPATNVAPAPSSATSPLVTPPKTSTPAKPADNPDETTILAFCGSLDDGKGAPWEDIVADAAKKGIKEEQVEECLNALMDKGLIYEPVLGRLKKT
ncbi:MAG: hypothetical protein WDA16_00365 [Candidatus Thermoplasmatota archaeon]